ncbi:MAG: protein kinase [Gemmatimonadota bacterium]|jgi:serine/threonine-protein kinase
MTSNAHARLSAALADRYRIERELGAGGMATVYLAEDLKHDRKVALKVLKPELAAVVGAERFLAEIRTTAHLQHPNILPLFDSGESDGFLYFVMPYVEDETLRSRLDREKQLPVGEAVRIATEVAEALQAAHDRGVIHRDIKPANILLSRGRPIVADFGIALAVSTAGGGRLTETGLSLGTPYYMSPEQASADRAPSAASDIYSLGCVLYEMLVGDPPYTGSTAQAVLARILTAEVPAATAARPGIPANVDAAIRKALERLPADRFTNAQDFARALGDSSFRHGNEPISAAAAKTGTWKRLAFAAATIALVAVAVAGRALMRSAPPTQVARFGSLFLPGQGIVSRGDFAIAPDGSFLVYVGPSAEAGGLFRLWVRRFRDLEAVPVPGTSGFYGLGPSVSPDGSEVAFGGQTAEGTAVVPVRGGPARMLMPAKLDPFWGKDGYIYAFASGEGIYRVPAGGGAPEQISRIDPGDRTQQITDILPGNRSALVTVGSGDVEDVRLLDLETGETRRIASGSGARYVDPGYLVYLTEDGTLAGSRFDAGAGELHEPVVSLLNDVDEFSLSDTGTLLYAPLVTPALEFVWMTRDGNASPVAPGWTVEGLVTRGFALSPEGRRLALTVGSGQQSADIWAKELPDGPMQRLTFDAGEEWGPRWAPSGERITYTAGVTGGRAVLSIRANGTGAVDTLFGATMDAPDAQLDPNGEWMVLRVGRAGGRDRYIAAGRVGPDEDPPAPIIGEPYNAVQPALSPDGRLIAYTSDESGRNEIYLRPFPDVGADRVVVSAGGGMQPRWSRDGRELFYVTDSGDMMAARIEAVPTARVVERQRLFTLPSGVFGLTYGLATNYDVAGDGRFLMARVVSDPDTPAPGLIVVQNWIDELKQAVSR